MRTTQYFVPTITLIVYIYCVLNLFEIRHYFLCIAKAVG